MALQVILRWTTFPQLTILDKYYAQTSYKDDGLTILYFL